MKYAIYHPSSQQYLLAEGPYWGTSLDRALMANLGDIIRLGEAQVGIANLTNTTIVAVEEIPGKTKREEVPLSSTTDQSGLKYAVLIPFNTFSQFRTEAGYVTIDINQAQLYDRPDDAEFGGWRDCSVVGIRETVTELTYRVVELEGAQG